MPDLQGKDEGVLTVKVRLPDKKLFDIDRRIRWRVLGAVVIAAIGVHVIDRKHAWKGAGIWWRDEGGRFDFVTRVTFTDRIHGCDLVVILGLEVCRRVGVAGLSADRGDQDFRIGSCAAINFISGDGQPTVVRLFPSDVDTVALRDRAQNKRRTRRSRLDWVEGF